jgi:hypothetical protein
MLAVGLIGASAQKSPAQTSPRANPDSTAKRFDLGLYGIYAGAVGGAVQVEWGNACFDGWHTFGSVSGASEFAAFEIGRRKRLMPHGRTLRPTVGFSAGVIRSENILPAVFLHGGVELRSNGIYRLEARFLVPAMFPAVFLGVSI